MIKLIEGTQTVNPNGKVAIFLNKFQPRSMLSEQMVNCSKRAALLFCRKKFPTVRFTAKPQHLGGRSST